MNFVLSKCYLKRIAQVNPFFFYFIVSIIILVGCRPVDPTSTVAPVTEEPAYLPTQPSSTLSPTASMPPPSPSPQPQLIWLAPYLPEQMASGITLPEHYQLASTPEEADIILDVSIQEDQVSQWIYALVAPFPTITDGVTSEELRDAWSGETVSVFDGSPLLMDEKTLGALAAFWGPPGLTAVKVLPAEGLVDYAWSEQPSWAILPFETLNPRWKVLAIDGESPVRKNFDPSTYPLTIPFGLSGGVDLQPEGIGLPATNRDASKLTTLAMTGVTAMVRATAYTMEMKGITYPAQDIGPLLADADITHISNEIPFAPDCPFPSFYMDGLVFCSSPDYIDLLKAVGTDIVELTGDHFMDYGTEATLYTLDMYDQVGWPYFGGGANAEQARQPVLIENNGNKLAFMGCNIGCQVKNEIPCDAIATESHPGAAQCDFDWLETEIPALREQGYQVIFTFQHREYYTYTTEPVLADDFGLVAAYGASIVSGSQAHQPHGYFIDESSFIHYGLGNLFFDQYHFCADYACDDAFIDQHVFYAGKHITTELITIRFVDTARPRLMTPEEREQFLEIIFDASGW